MSIARRDPEFIEEGTGAGYPSLKATAHLHQSHYPRSQAIRQPPHCSNPWRCSFCHPHVSKPCAPTAIFSQCMRGAWRK